VGEKRKRPRRLQRPLAVAREKQHSKCTLRHLRRHHGRKKKVLNHLKRREGRRRAEYVPATGRGSEKKRSEKTLLRQPGVGEKEFRPRPETEKEGEKKEKCPKFTYASAEKGLRNHPPLSARIQEWSSALREGKEKCGRLLVLRQVRRKEKMGHVFPITTVPPRRKRDFKREKGSNSGDRLRVLWRKR